MTKGNEPIHMDTTEFAEGVQRIAAVKTVMRWYDKLYQNGHNWSSASSVVQRAKRLYKLPNF